MRTAWPLEGFLVSGLVCVSYVFQMRFRRVSYRLTSFLGRVSVWGGKVVAQYELFFWIDTRPRGVPKGVGRV